MLRRLYHDQPERFAFTPANLEWARGQVAKYPEGRQASAVIPLLWRAQEQEGWVSKPAIEEIARMLGMAYIRVLEVATFYFMFQLQPVGSVAHVQVCGTTSCMICGAEELIAVCREKIAPRAHELSADGRFSWEEVECLGACANAPMAQIGKDYYEDLTPGGFAEILDAFARGEVPRPGPQNGRFSSEPLGGPTTLTGVPRTLEANASVDLALALGDTVGRVRGEPPAPRAARGPSRKPRIDAAEESDTGPAVAMVAPPRLAGPRGPGADDLKLIKGVERKLEEALNGLGYFHFDQIANWSPAEVAWIDANLEGYPGRATRDGWVEQARELAEEGDTPHAHARVERLVEVEVGAARPQGRASARDGGADDLKRIRGVGPKLEALLHGLGVYHFDQIAAWTGAELAWVDAHLEGFRGRASRDDWIGQARILAAGGETEHSRRVDRGEFD
jgi:NADH-quinone oxidoreductase subunit E